MTTNRLIRGMIWLSRIGCCRGFGIQSPWAYSLVRYVINEHYPYYAYECLAKDFPEADAVRRKMGEFSPTMPSQRWWWRWALMMKT